MRASPRCYRWSRWRPAGFRRPARPASTRSSRKIEVLMIARSRWIILPSVFLLVSLLGVLDAKQPPAQCGTHPTRRQEELFLHGRHTAMRARNGLATAAEQRLAVTNRDI